MPPAQRFLLAVGLPVVAVVAFVQRGRTSRADTGDEAGATLVVTPGSGITAIDPTAIGISAGQIGRFSESFTSEIGLIEKRLETVETINSGAVATATTGAAETPTEPEAAPVPRVPPVFTSTIPCLVWHRTVGGKTQTEALAICRATVV